MATLVLGAAGAAVGTSLGGSVLGLSAAVIGRAAGATLGRALDQRLMGSGSDVVETGRVERFRLTGASEGAALGRVFGRVRLGGQVIWASRFRERRETTEVGSKGGGGQQSVRSYSYTVSLAIGLCEGEISQVGRIWADGAEIGRDRLQLRVYTGGEDQMPDAAIVAVEGRDRAPAYRGLAYVVIEDLDLGEFGNRVPQFTFEVIRPDLDESASGAPSVTNGVEAVALIPGTGEYSLATTPVRYPSGPGRARSANQHTPGGLTDFEQSITSLEAELPSCQAVSLIVSWFGDDLRCGVCDVRPKIEQNEIDGAPMPWTVSGADRQSGGLVPRRKGDPVYGGTPSDASVREAIAALRGRGQEVMFYPFILMEQLAGNGRTDPWTGAEDQPDLPWRGRITLSQAPGRAGSPDGTAQADAEVRAFFGEAEPEHFTIGNGGVSYTGPEDWGLRRFILHYAALCASAGGVDAFCIGSEMRGLTQIRGASGFPAVAEMVRLAEDVRQLVGPAVKIGYAADWSEYFGYTPQDGSGDHFFHLDPLWAHPDIDFIGIDNYMPLSDWRDEAGHADADWGSIYNLAYLTANVAGGEGYDWYYPDADSVAEQTRLPITDGAYGEPWVYRYKDLLNWWSKPHHDRSGGVRQATPTEWQPRSKPFWFTEYGCAAIDKGANQPNKFLDPKSSESKLPRASNGARDDLMQMQYLRAMLQYWGEGANNPVSPIYGGPMVDMSHAFVWAWDARPYPWFPALGEVWNDGENYARGHWLNGRSASRGLAAVVAEICDGASVRPVDVSSLWGVVRGYSVAAVQSGRETLQPLMLAYGFDAVERDGVLVFRHRDGSAALDLSEGDLARHPEQAADLLVSRGSGADLPWRIRMTFVEADGNFAPQVIETAYPGGEGQQAQQSELNLVLSRAEARAVTERWLSEARVAQDTARFSLPPSRMHVGAGDVVTIRGPSGATRWRIDRAEQFGLQMLEATRIEPEVYAAAPKVEEVPHIPSIVPPMPPAVHFLDLPLLTGNEAPHAPHIAVTADPWPGEAAVFWSIADTDYRPLASVAAPASVGATRSALVRAEPGRLDRGAPLVVWMPGGALSSVPEAAFLGGANLLAIGDGSADGWEVFQYQTAEMVGPDLWELALRLRGQLGTDAAMPDVWPAGSVVVRLDAAVEQLPLPASSRGLSRHYRVGPGSEPYSSASFQHLEAGFEGVGLRPYAPVHMDWRRNAAGADEVRWIRRTRIDGDLWSAGDVPMGEAQELYRIRALAGGSLRVETETTQPFWSVSLADRAAVGLTGSYEVEVAQISDRFGPGPFRRITIDADG